LSVETWYLLGFLFRLKLFIPLTKMFIQNIKKFGFHSFLNHIPFGPYNTR
jgi:hypothetical protein